MSFTFDWQSFAHQNQFLARCRGLLTDALNRKRPGIIESPIKVRELNWGSQAPTLEILDIGDVASDRFRGIFKLNYSGEAYITLATNVQANLLNVYQQTAPNFTLPSFVAAPTSLSIPLILTLSDIELSGIVIIVWSKARGLTLVFRNDPLVSITVSSSFHSVPGIAQFLQSQIETQIRGLFRDELPAILYRHSQRWNLSSQPQLAASLVAAKRHMDRRRMRLLDQHKQLQVQLHNEQPDEGVEEGEDEYCAPVTFAEMNEKGKNFSLGNLKHMEAIALSRKTLAITVPAVSGVVYKSELFHRMSPFKTWGPVGLSGPGLYFNVHHQADRIAARSSHKMRKRVIKIKKKPVQTEEVTPSEPEPQAQAQAQSSAPAQLHAQEQEQKQVPELDPVALARPETAPITTSLAEVPHLPSPAEAEAGVNTCSIGSSRRKTRSSRASFQQPMRTHSVPNVVSFDLKQAMFNTADRNYNSDNQTPLAPPPAYVA